MPWFLEDPLTGDFASRNELEDEEEAALATNLQEQYAIIPKIDVRAMLPIAQQLWKNTITF